MLLLQIYGIGADTVWIWPGCFFDGRSVTIGRDTIIMSHCFFDSFAPITIGSSSGVGPDVAFITSTHQLGTSERRFSEPAYGLPIKVGDGVWIGARATILPGVTIGNGCVIAAGAVVRTDCDPDGLYAGVPARRLRDI